VEDLVRFAKIVELLHIAIEGEFFQDSAVRNGRFFDAERTKSTGIQLDRLNGLGQLEFGHTGQDIESWPGVLHSCSKVLAFAFASYAAPAPISNTLFTQM
jgi:hypothetical protein